MVIVDKDLKMNDVRNGFGNNGFDFNCFLWCIFEVMFLLNMFKFYFICRKSGGIMAVTIRDSFLNKSPNFRNELGIKCLGFKKLVLIKLNTSRMLRRGC